MLLTKKAIVKWNPSNREWYTSKGYKYTYWHEELEVPVEDLAVMSPYPLQCICDYCGSEFEMRFSIYYKKSQKDKTGKHACRECEKLRKAENSVTVVANSNNNLKKQYVVILDNDYTMQIQKCNTCLKFKEISCFKEDSSYEVGYSDKCTECHKDLKEFDKDNVKLQSISKTSKDMNLPVSLTEKQMRKITKDFNQKCALTDSSDYIFEHFIPVSWGHGGTYLGNVYLLRSDLNSSKSNMNPFKWMEKQLKQDRFSSAKWKKLIRYLAKLNGLTYDEFREYVYWCEGNKRKRDKILRDGNKMSLDLWKKSKNRK